MPKYTVPEIDEYKFVRNCFYFNFYFYLRFQEFFLGQNFHLVLFSLYIIFAVYKIINSLINSYALFYCRLILEETLRGTFLYQVFCRGT